MTLFLITLVGVLEGRSQVKKITQVGHIRGVLRDSLSKEAVSSATLTIYLARNGNTIKYLFSNRNGAFRLDSLPVDIPLLLYASHIGYEGVKKEFTIPADGPLYDFQEILLNTRDSVLNEVVITGERPPMVMRGDTLEINAEAFKTKPNAVVEDLLRKVPGIVIWADGKITVNGKEVSKLLVEGKPFFGHDPVVAMRNLPKDAIDKVQIYKEILTGRQDEDPTLAMNVALKKDKKSGFFGKMGGGRGTDKRYDGTISLNAFTPKSQFTVVSATNNTNKESYNITDMLSQSVYKPGGENQGVYRSDFSKEGLNQFRLAGARYNGQLTERSNLSSEYFYYNTSNETKRFTESTTNFGSGFLRREDAQDGKDFRLNHNLEAAYRYDKDKWNFTIIPQFVTSRFGTNYVNQATSQNEDGRLLNSYLSQTNFSGQDRTSTVSGDYRKEDGSLQIRYYLAANESENSNDYSSRLEYLNTFVNNEYNRRTNATSNTITSSLYTEFSLGSAAPSPKGISKRVINTITYTNRHNSAEVFDFDAEREEYLKLNEYLSNRLSNYSFEERPGLKLSRFRFKELPNRYYKSFIASMQLDMQVLYQKNISEQAIQNIKRNYISPLPSFSLDYRHTRHGYFERNYRLVYLSSVNIPTVEHLAPLVDSAQQISIYKGNPGLEKEYKHDLSFTFVNAGARENAGRFTLRTAAGFIQNKFTDSSSYDDIGRRIGYIINYSGYWYANMGIQYVKPLLLFKSPLNIMFDPSVNYSRSPYFVNGFENKSGSLYRRFHASVDYLLNDLLQLNINADIESNQNTLKSANGTTRLTYSSSRLGTSLQVKYPDRITLINDLVYHKNTATGSRAIGSLIWNINLHWRLLKKENLELKLTASDLLRQRTNVVYEAENNFVSLGTVNNLRQFFIFSISYYPRQFGFKKKNAK